MFEQSSFEELDELFRAYGVIRAYGDHLGSIEREVATAFKENFRNEPDFYELTRVVRASVKPIDIRPRKVAWLSQQSLGSGAGRSICVNQKVVKFTRRDEGGDRHATSPLIRQLEAYGVSVAESVKTDVSGFFTGPELDALSSSRSCLDAMVLDRDRGSIFLVAGVAAADAKRASPNLLLASREKNLFVNDGRPFTHLRVPRRSVEMAHLAHRLLEAAETGFSIHTVVMVVDTYEGSWTFQATDVSDSFDSRSQFLEMDDRRVVASILDSARSRAESRPDYGVLGIAPSSRHLYRLPIDRVTRPLMLLSCLLEEQIESEKSLALLSSSQLRDRIKKRFGIVFDRDVRRHDLEDALCRSNWVVQVQDRDSGFFITPAGIALACFIDNRYGGAVKPLAERALHLMAGQADRIRRRKHRRGVA